MNEGECYDDLMNELERGEINFYKPEITTNFFGRKMKRNISESSIVSSEKSIESITPEPDECFNWELNGDESVTNSLNSDDSLLEANYRKYNLNKSSEHLESYVPSNNKLFMNYESTLHSPLQAHTQRKSRGLYHRMSQFNSNKKNEKSLENPNNLMSYHHINPYSNQSYNTTKQTYETRLNIH